MDNKILKDEELILALKEIIETKKANITTIAKGVNMSPATISEYLQGRYKGRVDKLEEALNKYLNTFKKTDNALLKKLDFAETSIATRVFNAAQMCQVQGKMGIVTGMPGIGKTTAIKEYEKRMGSVILVDPFEMSNARTILKQIADVLKIQCHNNMSVNDIAEVVVNRLKRNKFLIIIDEAENVKIEVFKIIRKIHDRTEGALGVLFIGTEELFYLVQKVRNGFPYISSRIGYLEQLNNLDDNDIEKLVLQIFPNIDKSLIRDIGVRANYKARSVKNILDLCVSLTQSLNEKINSKIIAKAASMLLI